MSVIRQVEALGQFRLFQTITFTNEGAGAVAVFTVTDDVLVSIIPVINADLTSAAGANIRLGIVGNDDSMIVDTLATDMDAVSIWLDASPDSKIEPFDSIRRFTIVDSANVILTLDAQIDTGQIYFHCFWTPLNGTVVNA